MAIMSVGMTGRRMTGRHRRTKESEFCNIFFHASECRIVYTIYSVYVPEKEHFYIVHFNMCFSSFYLRVKNRLIYLLT